VKGKTLEFKRDLSSPDGVLKAIVAFANTSGGVVVLGVEDRTKTVIGVQGVWVEEERLTSLIADCISPKLIPSVEVLPWRKKQVLVVEVLPSPNRPHHLVKLGPDAGVFVRVGSTNRKADPFLIGEMRRYNQVSSFDEQPMPDLNSEEVDFRVASELFAPLRKLTAQGLQSLKVTTNYQGRVVPTIGGMLLFGVRREEYFPDAWVQVGRFAGIDKRRIVDSAEVRTHLPGAAGEVIAFLQKHMMREVVIGAVKRVEVWTYPAVAVREAAMNAIVHADYGQRGAPIRIALFDDRLEIENPGLLPFGLTIEEIKKGVSKLRNRVIGRVFEQLRLIEQWGSGIQRMTAACVDVGLAAPQFDELGTHFRVTLRAKRHHAPRTDKRESAILTLLAGSPSGLSTSHVAKKLRISARAARTRLAALVERGMIAEIGSGPHDPHRRYHLVSRA